MCDQSNDSGGSEERMFRLLSERVAALEQRYTEISANTRRPESNETSERRDPPRPSEPSSKLFESMARPLPRRRSPSLGISSEMQRLLPRSQVSRYHTALLPQRAQIAPPSDFVPQSPHRELELLKTVDSEEDDTRPGHEPDDSDDTGVPPRPRLAGPDLVLQSLLCFGTPLVPVSRQSFEQTMIAELQTAEVALNQKGISLFPNPQIHGGCYDGRELHGEWGVAYPGPTSDQDQLLQHYDFLSPKGPAALVITQVLLDKMAQAVENLLSEILFRHGLILIQVEIKLFGPPKQAQQVRTVLRGHVRDAPFPINLWGIDFNITLIETLSMDDAGHIWVHTEVDAEVDLDPLVRIFEDLGLLPFLGLFPGVPPPVTTELILSLADDLATVYLQGKRIVGPAAILLQMLPHQLLLPGACTKLLLDYADVDVASFNPPGIRVTLCLPRVAPRKPSVAIRPLTVGYENPIRVRISRIRQAPLVVEAHYQLADIRDLRGDPNSQLQIAWNATHALHYAFGVPTRLQVYFNLNRFQDQIQVGLEIHETVSVRVIDLDECRAMTSYSVTILVVADPEPYEPPPRRSDTGDESEAHER
jgi:hypothetical protein